MELRFLSWLIATSALGLKCKLLLCAKTLTSTLLMKSVWSGFIRTGSTDPYKRVTRCNSWSSYYPQRRWVPHNLVQIMRNDLFQSYLAVIGGAGLGFLVCIFGQQFLNYRAVTECAKPGIRDYHRVILTTGFLGDTKYCIHTKYLAN